MRKTYFILAGTVLGLAFNLHAQTATLGGFNNIGTPIQTAAPDSIVAVTAEAQGLSLVAPSDLPPCGTFWLISSNGVMAPMPCPLLDQNLPTYAIADNIFLVDGTGGQVAVNPRLNRQMTMAASTASAVDSLANAVVNLINQVQVAQASQQMQMMSRAMGVPMPGGGGGNGGDATNNNYVAYTWDTNQLWLSISNVSNGTTYANLHNATNLGGVYAIWGTTNLTTPFALWNVETELWPTSDQTNILPFALANLGRQDLFLRAEDWTGVTENGNTTPDWWFWLYFGTTALSDTNQDANGNTLLSDYQNSTPPTVFTFTNLEVANNYVSSSSIPVQLDVTGNPYYLATLVDDSNFNDAVWNVYSGSTVSINLGLTEGWHDVWIGLRGHADDPTNAVWQWKRLKLDYTPPALIVTNPVMVAGGATTSVPVIQIQGYCSEALASISYDLSNAAGTVTNQLVLVLDQQYDTNNLEFTTNTFQAFDVPLTNGLNVFTLHATDLAGNVTTTNFSFTLDYSSKTNPPVLQVNWPLAGVAICGSNFTCNGSVSDPTASVTVQLVDTNGDTNVLSAAVGRDGNFWTEYLPLSSGTNYLTLTATDATGTNTTTTNLMVIQGNVGLAIDTVLAGQTLVTGEIDPSIANSYTIWVNGTAATNNGDGTWTAQIASIGMGGGVVEAMAIPNTDNGGNGLASFDKTGNPQSPQANGVQTPVKAPEGIYFSMYRNSEQYVYSNWGDPETWYDWITWHDGQGGGAATYQYYDWDTDFPWLNTITWPATSWPQALPNGAATQIEWNLSPTNYYYHPWSTTNTYTGGSPSQVMERCLNITCSNRQVYATRQADSEIKLATGGKAGSTQMNLWMISASATAINGPFANEYWLGSSTQPIDPKNISVFGKTLGSDGNLYVLLPDNATPDATPTIANAPAYYTYNVTAQKYRLTITANGKDLSVTNPEFCVGQNVTFTLNGLPGDVVDMKGAWSLPQKFVNEAWQHTNWIVTDPISGAGYWQPYGSVNYRINSSLLENTKQTSCWFYNGKGGHVSVGLNLKFQNGQYVSVAANGDFAVYRPTITNFIPDNPISVVLDTNGLPSIYLGLGAKDGAGGGMGWNLDVHWKTTFNGTFYYTQLIDREWSWDITTFHLPRSSSTGGFWLDNANPYSAASSVDTSQFRTPHTQATMIFGDAPELTDDFYSFADLADSFNTYLQFQPAGGIPVTIGLVTWGWHGQTAVSDGVWSLATGDVTGPNLNGSDDAFPEWTTVYYNSPN